MKLFTRSFFALLAFLFVPSVFSAGTFYAPADGYSFSTTCATDGSSCDNMREQDDKYNSWVNTHNKKSEFTFESFNVPDSALIQDIYIILRLRDSIGNSVWKAQVSRDGGLTYSDTSCGNNCLFYASTSFNTLIPPGGGWNIQVPFYIFDPNPVTGKDINSAKLRLRITNKYSQLSNVDIDKVAFYIQYYVSENTPTPTPIPAKTPLILIPGIAGSELKTSEMKVWAENDGHGGTFNYLYSKDETV